MSAVKQMYSFFCATGVIISCENWLALAIPPVTPFERGNIFSVGSQHAVRSGNTFSNSDQENQTTIQLNKHSAGNEMTRSTAAAAGSSTSENKQLSHFVDNGSNTTVQSSSSNPGWHDNELSGNTNYADFEDTNVTTVQRFSQKSEPEPYTDFKEKEAAVTVATNPGTERFENVTYRDFEEKNMITSSTTKADRVVQYEIEVIHLSPTRGIVQSPSDFTIARSTVFTRKAYVTLPLDHHVVISLPWLRMPVDSACIFTISRVELYVGELLEWMSCGDMGMYFQVNLYRAAGFAVYLSYIFKGVFYGFRTQFSLHNRTALPVKRADGKWNCSVPQWPDFQHHLSCNLHGECAGGEDETGCDFQSEACGPGLISAAGNCYKYIEGKDRLNWYEAIAVCKEEGGYVASLNTPKEWIAVTKLFERVVTRFIQSALSFENPALPDMYRYIPMWADQTMAYYRISAVEMLQRCNSFDFEWAYTNTVPVSSFDCKTYDSDVLCEMEKPSSAEAIEPVTVANATSMDFSDTQVVECPTGHMTHTALACDVRTSCWGRGYGATYTCDVPLPLLPPTFTCANQFEFVPYALVCDFREDCTDASDEAFCVFPPCGVGEFNCGNEQCVYYVRLCDEIQDCNNGVDEKRCLKQVRPRPLWISQLPYQVIRDAISLDLQIRQIYYFWCGSSYFKCRTTEICLPLELRCNDVYDCPGREDEAGCDTCPGLYRCRSSAICLHPNMICDQLPQCPQLDDEQFCGKSCPDRCECFALSAVCSGRFSVRETEDLRFLDASGSGMTLADVTDMVMLVHLGMGSCGLKYLHNTSLPNVQYVDVSDNFLTGIEHTFLHQFPNLQVLLLDGNLLNGVFMGNTGNTTVMFPRIKTLGLSRLSMTRLSSTMLTAFPNLQVLNFSGSGIAEISGPALNFLSELTTLDTKGCPLTTVPPDLIRHLHKLTTVAADNYKLCCLAMLPEDFSLARCHAPSDEISSCDALLRSDAYRALLSVFATLALIGNLGSFIYRAILSKTRSDQGFGVFVTYLSVSDLLMGVYLAVIGVADRVYLGSYLWRDDAWKSSSVCSLAGFLSLLSCETSAFIICLITLDRFLVLRFPFSQLRFHKKSAHIASGFVWLVGTVLAAVPLLPVTSHWEFYQQNGICLPLPITKRQFPGQSYSFSVMIVLNIVLFLLIGVGQLSIYYTVKTNTMSSADTNATSKDLAIARRLITIAVSDFLCWFPIGVLGLLASTGTPISGEVNVAMAILALPLNAALNPFIYTYNMIVERRRKEKEKRLQRIIMAARQGKRDTVS